MKLRICANNKNIIRNSLGKFIFTSNDRGITPRCGDPDILTPCIVYDFPDLKISLIFITIREEQQFYTLFVRKQILLRYILRAPERKIDFLFLCHFSRLTLSTSGKIESAYIFSVIESSG
jgi:hypothetical protein